MEALNNRVAIVTGAGQGVGRGVALALAAEGAKVAVTGRTMSKCEAVVAEIEDRGGQAVAIRCDVEQRSDVDETVAAVMERWGQIDILVNNAQTLIYKSVRNFAEEDLESMWQSGPVATLRFQQACFPHLRATKGAIINMGSGSSIMPHPLMSGYAMAKEAIRVLTRVTALEWAKFEIRVNAICPLAETPGWDLFTGTAPGAEEQVLATIPLGRMGNPESDIGRAVVYLAGNDASYITGTTLMLDGGFNYLR
ncbi:MAG: putative oxidoreductase, NAD(P)-binding domain [Acidimicrobiia bacterium]|nr:putative oxidoreductase, NAD(P)-binding domain [Acidimicrobiia bacterium]